MKTVKRDRPNKAWEKQKEERKRIDRYLKHGGRPVKRAQRTRGPNDGNGKPTWYEADTEVTFPEGYKNYTDRRADGVKRRKMTRIFKRAEKTGRNPLAAVKKFLGKDAPRMPMQQPAPFKPSKAEAPSVLGRIRKLFKRKGDR